MRTGKSPLLILLVLSGITFGATFTVTNTQDQGNGSLSWAITQANNNPGPDTIAFAIPTSDPNYNSAKKYWSINLLTQLPAITDDSTFVDGSTQEAFSGVSNPQGKELAIQGNKLSFEDPGFLVYSSGNTFFDFAIGGFRGVTFDFVGDSVTYNVIKGCYIGLEPTGRWGYNVNESMGIRFLRNANHNTIGGTNPEDKNVISGFNKSAVLIEKAGYNTIVGNIFGLAADEMTPIGNGWQDFDVFEPGKPARGGIASILLRGGAHHNVIGGPNEAERNVICAAGRAGIRIESVGSDSNVVRGNYLGLAADGETAVPNGEAGIQIAFGASYNQIGGTEPGEGNVISSNWSSGIQLRQNIRHNKIQGNYIGTNADGTLLVPNSHNGIYIFGDRFNGFPEDNEIGPGNIIIASAEEDPDEKYGYTWGAVRFDSLGTTRNIVHDNWIGTNMDGTLSSQWNSGVIIGGGAHHNQIGPGNVIANNAKWGVWVRQAGTVANTITQNRIYNNGWGAIVLEEDGNNLIDAPLITDSNPSGVSGKSLPNGTVEVFRSLSGQADEFVAAVPSDHNGNWSYSGPIASEDMVATFTDGDGNTSALSMPRTVPVELSSFYAEVSNGVVVLVWATESESNNLGFYVERADDSGEFSDVGFVPGKGTSSERVQYRFEDRSAAGDKIHYRLRQVDLDGKATLSNQIVVSKDIPTQFDLQPPYPNPFNNSVTIPFALPANEFVELAVFDVLGRKVTTLVNSTMEAGYHKVNWSGTDRQGLGVPSGLYYVRFESGGHRFAKRILLLK